MMPEATRAEELFLEALRQAVENRGVFLDAACAGESALRNQVERLLAAHATTGSFLEQPAVEPISDATGPHSPNGQVEPNGVATGPHSPQGQPATEDYVDPNVFLNQVIAGKYKLVEAVGEGGMGSVYMAQQTEPVKRMVAVKLIKAGMDSKAVLGRFEAERQALAVMDHPNIAKILDGGLHDNRPFFVMELVKGIPITKFCDDRKLSPKERLELFVPVCQAIQHAHQKGIIHRDIKPSNVLVALYDDRAVPKVIDFGVAKATGQQLTDASMFTGFGAVVGTPEYMSPEQASFNNLDVDTRSDVYALGVLLYELLAGSPPFRKKEMEKIGLLEIFRVIREVEPPRPSTKLSSSEVLPNLAANRSTEPKKLTGILRNELDWIVMKALEKDRTRRYETANGFAADVNRYLAGEAVLAHPPSAAYRVKKFVRRHRGRVIAAGLVLFALLVGIIGTTWGLIEAKKQERLAVAAQLAEAESAEGERRAKLDADARRQEAERNLTFARKGNDILGSVFTGLDPKAKYNTVAELRNALRDNLAKAVQELDGSAIGNPLEVANMQMKLGNSLLALGEGNLAIEVFGKSVATRQDRLGNDDPDTLISMNNLALGYQAVGQMDQALPLLEQTLRLRSAKLGVDYPDTLVSMNNLALGFQAVGQMDQALPLLKQSLQLTTAKLGVDHPDTLVSMSNLAAGYRAVGQMDKALPLYEQTLQLRSAKLGANHPHTLISMNNLALGYQAVGQMDQALPLHEQTLRLRSAKLGTDHPDTLTSMNNLALGYQQVGRMDQALPLLKQSLQLTTAKLGVDHPDTLISLSNLALGYRAVGQMDQALPLYEQTLQLMIAKQGADHPHTLNSMNNLASGYQEVGRMDKALALYEQTLQLRSAKLGADHPDTLITMNNLAAGYQALGQMDKALPLFERAATEIEKRRFRHENAKLIISNTIAAYERVRQFDRAEAWWRKWLAFVQTQDGAESPAYAGALAQLGFFFLNQQKWTDAESTLRPCLTIREKTQPDLWTTFNTSSLLGGVLLGQQKYADAEPLLLKGYEGMKSREKTIPPQGAIRLPEAAQRLVDLYVAWDKFDEAKKWKLEWAKYACEPLAMPKEVK